MVLVVVPVISSEEYLGLSWSCPRGFRGTRVSDSTGYAPGRVSMLISPRRDEVEINLMICGGCRFDRLSRVGCNATVHGTLNAMFGDTGGDKLHGLVEFTILGDLFCDYVGVMSKLSG
jgi:hypothetical protein